MNISGYLNIQKIIWRHWKLFHNRSSENVSKNGGFVGVGA